MSRAPRAKAKYWGSDDTGCHILHVDMDCFFAAVEELDNPALCGKPVIVGGAGTRGVVSAANYEARKYGVHSAMPIVQARYLCGNGVFLPVRMERYKAISAQVMQILGKVTPVLEQVSVDEAFLDVRGSLKRLGTPMEIAKRIRGEIRQELSLAASVGIGKNKYVAKLASGGAKPDGIFLVPAEATRAFAQSIDLAGMWSVGQATQRKLHAAGINTVKELANTPVEYLSSLVGKVNAQRLLSLAFGIDERPVEIQREEKSISTENTFYKSIEDPAVLQAQLLDQSHECARRLRKHGLLAFTVTIKIRYRDFQTFTRSHTLSSGTDLAKDIYREAEKLWKTAPGAGKPVRLIGVGVSSFSSLTHGRQLAWDENLKQQKAERTVDAICERFGKDLIKPASLLVLREE